MALWSWLQAEDWRVEGPATPTNIRHTQGAFNDQKCR